MHCNAACLPPQNVYIPTGTLRWFCAISFFLYAHTVKHMPFHPVRQVVYSASKVMQCIICMSEGRMVMTASKGKNRNYEVTTPVTAIVLAHQIKNACLAEGQQPRLGCWIICINCCQQLSQGFPLLQLLQHDPAICLKMLDGTPC